MLKRSFVTISKQQKKTPAHDQRIALIKSMIYENPGTNPVDHKAQILPKSLRSSPISPEMNDQVERMWYLQKAIQAHDMMQELKDSYQMMRNAMKKLQQLDDRLFQDALKKPDLSFFHEQYRIPTETAPLSGFPKSLKKE